MTRLRPWVHTCINLVVHSFHDLQQQGGRTGEVTHQGWFVIIQQEDDVMELEGRSKLAQCLAILGEFNMTYKYN